MDYKQHKGKLRGQIKNKTERKLYNKRIRSEEIDVDNISVSEKIKEALAKYWYDNEYNLIDKNNHKKAEESRKKFLKWLDCNLDSFIK